MPNCENSEGARAPMAPAPFLSKHCIIWKVVGKDLASFLQMLGKVFNKELASINKYLAKVYGNYLASF